MLSYESVGAIGDRGGESSAIEDLLAEDEGRPTRRATLFPITMETIAKKRSEENESSEVSSLTALIPS